MPPTGLGRFTQPCIKTLIFRAHFRFYLDYCIGKQYHADMTRLRRNKLTMRDGRTREAKLLLASRHELVAHVGGKPSATQRALIEQAAQLGLRLAIMDQTFNANGITEHDSRTYLAWANTYTRIMRSLGLKAASGPSDEPAGQFDFLMDQLRG
jgi:hypothetical protein